MGRAQGGQRNVGAVPRKVPTYFAGQRVIIEDGDGRELAGTVLYDDGGEHVPVVLDEGEVAVNDEWEDNPEYEVLRSHLRVA